MDGGQNVCMKMSNFAVMEIKSRCITLRTVKFKDSRSIVVCLVREIGRVSFIVSDGSGREARRRRALMMAGSSFDCVIDFRESRSVQTMRDLSPCRTMLIDNPAKVSIVLFLCDFINSLLRDCQRDRLLFDYIDGSIDNIVRAKGSVGNAPLCFLIGLQRFMGIEPDMSTYSPGSCFDMTGGVFRKTPPLTGRYLAPDESAAAVSLMRMTPRTMGLFRMSREQRKAALDRLIEYYTVHFGAIRSMNSLEVVRSLFE